MTKRLAILFVIWGLVAGGLAPAPHAAAQVNLLDNRPLGLGPDRSDDEDPVSVVAEFDLPPAGGAGELRLTAQIAENWHIYSITQKPGGPNRSRIKLAPSDQYRLLGEFQAQPGPHVEHNWPGQPALAVEEHFGQVTWRAPFELLGGADPQTLVIRGSLNVQACAESCLPPKDYAFAARWAAGRSAGPSDRARPGETGSRQQSGQPADAGQSSDAGPSSAADSEPGADDAQEPSHVFLGSHVSLRGHVEWAPHGKAGTAKLVLTARPAPGWHIYSLADQAPDLGAQPTLIRFSSPAGLTVERRSASVQPVVEPSRDPSLKPVTYHSEPVTWSFWLSLPETGAGQPTALQGDTALQGAMGLQGAIGFQTCAQAGQCDIPEGARFEAPAPVGDAPSSPLRFTASRYADVKRLPAASPQNSRESTTEPAPALPVPSPLAQSPSASSLPSRAEQPLNAAASLPRASLVWVLGAAFLGGLVLNFMPCVLPVIGLKILSFVEQAGKKRSQVLLLNIYYTLGMMLVFLGLATLAAVFRLGWGEQFTSTGFNVAMAGLVFVMALSFLGVWEIPIPGFVGGSRAHSLTETEGALGAIAKGVLTTILATPCSGPLLGSVFGYTLEQPPVVTYLIFSAVGLGMSAPYLLIGAFPNLIRFLPKPGGWMNTFKQLMGFAMLGGVVILLSFIRSDVVVATVGMLIGLWLGCWWINRTPAYAGFPRLVAAWTTGVALAAVTGGLAFMLFLPAESLIAWRPYSSQTLKQLHKEGRTVLVDFTAEWCLTCKTNLRFAINTPDVAQAIERNGVVPLLADWTDGSEEIHTALRALGSNSIPLLAIFPASRPDKPIILRDLLFKSEIVRALDQAGPSAGRGAPAIMSTAADR